MLRDYGRVSKYEHVMVGFNSRLDTLQAAILRAKLKKIDTWNKMRQDAAGLYNKFLKGSNIITPYAASFAKHVYHVYAVRAKDRDSLCEKLKSEGVAVIIHYPIPLHLQKAYADLGYKKGDFPVSEKVSQEIMSLPMFPHIKEKEIEFIAKILKGDN